MSGTKSGGKKASKTNKERWGNDFYKRIGQKGGRNSKLGGFASEKIGKDGLTGKERAALAGRKGGLKSRRGKAKKDKEPVKKQPAKKPVRKSSNLGTHKKRSSWLRVFRRNK